MTLPSTTDIPAPFQHQALALSVRQRQVLELLAGGRTYPEMMDILNLSRASVNQHMRHLRLIANVQTTIQLAAKASEILARTSNR